jgi:hypothetical protein
MTRRELAEALTRLLVAHHEITCALGTITLREYLRYEGRDPQAHSGATILLPYYIPAEELLAAALGDDRVPANVPTPAPGSINIYDPWASSDPTVDELEEELALDQQPDTPPPGTSRPRESLEIGELFAEAAAALRDRKRFRLLGVGDLVTRRLTRRRLDLPPEIIRADAELAGKWTIYMDWSPVVRNLINDPRAVGT